MSKAIEKNTIPMFQFRSLTYLDKTYKAWVCVCLETGSTTTADAPEETESEMLELLEDESDYAIKHRNLTNLFSSPAFFDKWIDWQSATPQAQHCIKSDREEVRGILYMRREVAK